MENDPSSVWSSYSVQTWWGCLRPQNSAGLAEKSHCHSGWFRAGQLHSTFLTLPAAPEDMCWLPAKVPLKMEVKYKTRESWDKMSMCVYGKTYPFLSDVMENPSLVDPSQGHFINWIKWQLVTNSKATNQISCLWEKSSWNYWISKITA